MDYNLGYGYDIYSGKFEAPVTGIYLFSAIVRSDGSESAYLGFYLDGNEHAYVYRDEDNGKDSLTLVAQGRITFDQVKNYDLTNLLNRQSLNHT